MVDTPRSTSSSGTPRDDRFFSPREYSSRSARTTSSTDSVWMTPRQDNSLANWSDSINSEDGRVRYTESYSEKTSHEEDINEDLFQQVQQSSSEKFVSCGTERSQCLLPSFIDNYLHYADAHDYPIQRAQTQDFGYRSHYNHIYERNTQYRNNLTSNGEYHHGLDSRQARGSVIKPEYISNNGTVRASNPYERNTQYRNNLTSNGEYHHELDSRQARGSVIRPEYISNNGTVRASNPTESKGNGHMTEEDVQKIFM